MARKKREVTSGGNAPWLNTFSDLMNLLLCFFVMLFAASEIDAEKFEQISVSMANSFGILDGGQTSILDGQLISNGMTQLNNLGEYYSNMGEDSHRSDIENEGKYDPTTKENSQPDVNEAMDKLREEMAEVSEEMYDKLSDLADQYSVSNYVELSIDPEYQFVQISLKGNILFDSGEAVILEEAKPILSKIGDVLTKFKDYTIEIEGHTDNVPMTNGKFENNNWLSSARALNAAEYLIEEKGLDPSKLKYSGRGEYEPIAGNDTSEGRAKNRRIEIKIYNELSGK